MESQIIFGTVYTKFPSVTSLVYQCGEWRFRLIWDSVDDIPSIRDWLGLYMDIFGTVCTVQYYDPSDSARQIPCFFLYLAWFIRGDSDYFWDSVHEISMRD